MPKNVNRRRIIPAALLAVLAVILSTQAVGNAGTIAGVVRNASGEPVSGASVKARNTDRGITFMVISQGQGRYQVNNLPPGKYTVQAQGGGLQSEGTSDAPVELGDSQTATVNLSLTAWQSLSELNTPSYAALLPEGEAKPIIMMRCVGCHGLDKVVPRRQTRDGWMESVEKMRDHPYGNRNSVVLTDSQRDVIVDYLAKNLGRDAPLPKPERDLPKVWLQGAATQYIAMEYKIPGRVYPHDVAVDSNGIAWVSERLTGNIGRFDPNSLTYTQIPLPPGNSTKWYLNAIEVDPEDRVWLIDAEPNDRLVMYDPKTEDFTLYDVPKPPYGGTVVNTIRFHPNGTVWMTGITADRIVGLNPDSKEFSMFPVPSGKVAHPYGMAIDPSGAIWFAENFSGKVAKLDLSSGNITEYDVPTPANLRSLAAYKGRGGLHDLRRMATDMDGNLWYGGHGLSTLGMIDYRTAEITEYPVPTRYSGPYSVDVDREDNLIWVSEMLADQIARFDPRTKTFVEFPLPSKNAAARRIEVDRSRPKRVWFSGSDTDTVGYLEVIE